jgi:hypothetical protein
MPVAMTKLNQIGRYTPSLTRRELPKLPSELAI